MITPCLMAPWARIERAAYPLGVSKSRILPSLIILNKPIQIAIISL